MMAKRWPAALSFADLTSRSIGKGGSRAQSVFRRWVAQAGDLCYPNDFQNTLSQQMTQFVPLGQQVGHVVPIWFHFDGHLLDDFQPIAFQTDDLFRVVREQPNRLETEIDQNLRAQAVFAEVHRIS